MNKYDSIEGLTTGFKLMGVLLGAFGTLAGVVVIVSNNGLIGGGLVIVGAAILVGMLMYAIASALILLVDLARTSRETADHLALLRRRRGE